MDKYAKGARIYPGTLIRPNETEGNFVFTVPSAWGRLCRLKMLGPLRRTRQARELQKNIYWDTPDRQLFRKKAVLKLRLVRGGRSELTFKKESRRQGSISKRIEVTVPVRMIPLGAVMPAAWLELEPVRLALAEVTPPGASAHQLSRALVPSKKWVPVLTMETDRIRVFFSSGRPVLEMDLDSVRVARGGRVIKHRELELENIALPPQQFSEIVAAFKKEWAKKLKTSRFSKQQIAFQLLNKPGSNR